MPSSRGGREKGAHKSGERRHNGYTGDMSASNSKTAIFLVPTVVLCNTPHNDLRQVYRECLFNHNSECAPKKDLGKYSKFCYLKRGTIRTVSPRSIQLFS